MRQYTQFSYERLSQYIHPRFIRPRVKVTPQSVPGRASTGLQGAEVTSRTRPSKALTQLFQRLSDQAATRVADVHILDLGPARQNILELAARQPYKLHIADVVNGTSLSSLKPCEDKNHVLSIENWHGLLPKRPDDGFLAVLCWDIFNYLSVKDIQALSLFLGEICEPDARIHSISYTGKSMPVRPLNFELLTPATLYRRQVENGTVPAPRYGAGVIADLMQGFQIEHLYQHGSDAVEELYQFHGEWNFSHRNRTQNLNAR